MDPMNVSHSPVSLWDEQLDARLKFSAAQGVLECDVVIVGGGFTGLWTAWWLTHIAPHLSVAIVESQHVGFGASGRNGGWASALFPQSMDGVAQSAGREAARLQQQMMFDNVLELEQAIFSSGIACGWHRGGTLSLARTQAQVSRAEAELAYFRSWGFDEKYYQWLDASEASARLNSPNTRGALFTPWCARIQPAALCAELARVLTAAGVQIFEQSHVLEQSGTTVRTADATVTAGAVIWAIEAWKSQMAPRERIPVYSLMVATQPLPESFWDQVGLNNYETFADFRNLIIYGQRTTDNRIAFGGRGAPYHWGSSLTAEFDNEPKIHAAIIDVLHELIPATQDFEITHRWGGPLGIHRNWYPAVTWNEQRRTGEAGGYVGDGVAATFLAAKTLAHSVAGIDHPCRQLPWVNHASPLWEPEPVRWLAANAGLRAMTLADFEEKITRRPSLAARFMNQFLGH